MYAPSPPPQSVADLPSYIWEELLRLAQVVSTVDFLQVKVWHSPPDRPRDGMIVAADGTDWNPGSGAGFYGYLGGTWRYLG